MNRKLALCFAIAGLALANAKSYSLNLYQTSMMGNSELKAGEYQVELVDQKAVVHKGKVRVETPVTVETAAKKYDTTAVILNVAGGKSRIQEIHLGGTTTKLVLAD